MRGVICHLTITLITFFLGNVTAHLFYYAQSSGSGASVVVVETPAMPPELSRVKEGPRKLSPKELEVVSAAESFVCQNGYTEQQCGTAGRIYLEPGEKPDEVTKIWERRRNTLEGKAYGLTSQRKGRSTIWTVVFKYTERAGKDRGRVGRAWVIEDGPFVSRYFISFRHDFPLAKVERKV